MAYVVRKDGSNLSEEEVIKFVGRQVYIHSNISYPWHISVNLT